jgi:hypothetical protein
MSAHHKVNLLCSTRHTQLHTSAHHEVNLYSISISISIVLV